MVLRSELSYLNILENSNASLRELDESFSQNDKNLSVFGSDSSTGYYVNYREGDILSSTLSKNYYSNDLYGLFKKTLGKYSLRDGVNKDDVMKTIKDYY